MTDVSRNMCGSRKCFVFQHILRPLLFRAACFFSFTAPSLSLSTTYASPNFSVFLFLSYHLFSSPSSFLPAPFPFILLSLPCLFLSCTPLPLFLYLSFCFLSSVPFLHFPLPLSQRTFILCPPSALVSLLHSTVYCLSSLHHSISTFSTPPFSSFFTFFHSVFL